MVLMFLCHVTAFLLGGISHQPVLVHDKREEAVELISIGRMLSQKIELSACHETVKSISGLVSTYASSFNGKIQKDGTPHDPEEFTAASPTFAMGTWLLVYSPITDKYVVVVVTDRGPHVKGRVLDLSKVAMDALDLTKLGVSRCVITPITPLPVKIATIA